LLIAVVVLFAAFTTGELDVTVTFASVAFDGRVKLVVPALAPPATPV
jgi:hypothetical protein